MTDTNRFRSVHTSKKRRKNLVTLYFSFSSFDDGRLHKNIVSNLWKICITIRNKSFKASTGRLIFTEKSFFVISSVCEHKIVNGHTLYRFNGRLLRHSLQRHNTEHSKQIQSQFLNIHVSVSDLYLPLIGLPSAYSSAGK
jgi:hypothetical protein